VAEGERLSDAARATGEVFQIDEALRRLEAGTYGVCVDCEEDIDERRLKAVPEAARCISCQEIYDRDRMEGRHHATM
jgi:DnaK suppressor protein